MKAVKDIFSGVENEVKIRSLRGYQALTRSISGLREKIGTRAGSIIRKSARSKGGGQR